jgi:hypothetical protein
MSDAHDGGLAVPRTQQHFLDASQPTSGRHSVISCFALSARSPQSMNA